jgi:hypothetical protein
MKTQQLTARLLLGFAGLLVMLAASDVQAQSVRPADPRPMEPGYADNALFVKMNGDTPTLHSLAANLHGTEILGKPVIAGDYLVLDGESTQTAIVVLFTEDPAEFWFLTGQGDYGLITVHEDLSITWVDGDGNRGIIILF